ncbi:MAG TPA: signal peptidase I [Pyrinomonadaceae bacterium]|jgi:signal peptidase I
MRGLLKFAVFFAGLCLLAGCFAKPILIDGSDMKPAFDRGDRILIDKNPGEIKRGELVTFLYPKDRSKWYFKRIIALPNETIEIRAGKVFIDGRSLEEPYVDEANNRQKAGFPPRKIEPNQYFVMGDNRDNSSDSRYWGPVDEKLITGKYLSTYAKADE